MKREEERRRRLEHRRGSDQPIRSSHNIVLSGANTSRLCVTREPRLPDHFVNLSLVQRQRQIVRSIGSENEREDTPRSGGTEWIGPTLSKLKQSCDEAWKIISDFGLCCLRSRYTVTTKGASLVSGQIFYPSLVPRSFHPAAKTHPIFTLYFIKLSLRFTSSKLSKALVRSKIKKMVCKVVLNEQLIIIIDHHFHETYRKLSVH